ncbi:MAG: DUF1566 domain-containing protein, partial [Thiopseudomonas sp.]
MLSPHPKAPQRLTRWLVLLATCAAPLLAHANCTDDNTDDNYILGEAQGANDAGSTASAMHWPTGLVWKRCVEGMAFDSATEQCIGAETTNRWHTWANSYLPKYFAESGSYQHNAPADRDFLTSGDWRMAYKNELTSITQRCGKSPKVNRTVFPNTPSNWVWSGSPYAGNSSAAWIVDFDDGAAYAGNRDSSGRVRLARAGQSFATLTSPATRTGAAGATVTFDALTLAASTGTGQAWGGARISGGGNPAFQVNSTGDWVQEAIVKSTDQITVRLTAPAMGGNTATFTLRSGQTTGTDATGSNGGDEVTTVVDRTATFTASPRYTKIANNGAELPDTATLGTAASDWACTRDNATGKIWEVKTDDNGLRGKDYTYTWYDSNSTDGNLGKASGGTCAATGRCDTEKYAQDVNAVGLCGATDWRMPTLDELKGIVDTAPSAPKINHDFFPNTLSWSFWSGSPVAGDSDDARAVGFGDGSVYVGYRHYDYYVRLVRAGQSLAPVLSAPTVSSITHNSASVQATSNLTGTGYWLVQARDDDAPTPAQVRASGQSIAMTANDLATINLSSLNANTAYDLYQVAEDDATGQLSAPAQKVQFTTAHAPVPVDASCGAAAGVATATAPTAGLCTKGTPGLVTTAGGQHSWQCTGQAGGSDAGCMAPGIAAAGGTGSMTLAITGGAGCQIESVTAAAPPAGGPTGFSMPYGVLDFAVNSCTGTS